MSDEVKKITIDVIDTPRGPVPSAESIKKIIESWNSIIEIMNDNLVRLFNLLNKLNENVVKLTISLNNVSSKTDLLMKSIAEIKVTLSEIQNSINDINRQELVEGKPTTATYVSQNKISSGNSGKSSELRDLLFKGVETSISNANLENFIDQGLILKIPVESKVRLTKRSKELINFLKEYKVIGVESSVQDILRHVKILCSNLDLDCYYIDEIEDKKIKLYEDLFKAFRMVLRGKKILLVLLNSDGLLSLADKNVDMGRIRLLNTISEMIENSGGINAYVIFHLKSEEKLDPIIAKKLRIFRF